MMFENGLHIVEEQFKNFIAGYNYKKNPTGKKLNIGVVYSSGLDSSILLEVANNFKSTMNYDVHILYVSYPDTRRGLDADDLSVKKASKYGNKISMQICNTKCHSTKFNDDSFDAITDLIFKTPDLDVVLFPDTMDYVLETFLMRSLNGTTTENLRSATFLTSYDHDGVKQTIGRPFLGIKRAEMIDYARVFPVEFLSDDELYNIDVSDLVYIRNNLIPLINHRFNLNGFMKTVSNIREHVDMANNRTLDLDIKSGDWSVGDFLNLSIGNRMFLIREYFKVVHNVELPSQVVSDIRAKLQEDLTDLCIPVMSKFVIHKQDDRIRVAVTKEVSVVA